MTIFWSPSFVYLFIMASAIMPTFPESDSRLFIVLHWSVCLFLYQWYLFWVLCCVKAGICSWYSTFCFFKLSFGFVHPYIEHQLFLTTFCENIVGALIKIVTIYTTSYLNMLGKWELLYWIFCIYLGFGGIFLKTLHFFP